ncbi:MAG TPA: SPW repeat protein [Bryobacteraceae bacterium]|nr:SPW repeat protein [Bryobacteraceae bacterium]
MRYPIGLTSNGRMRFISTFVHGLMDYPMSLVLFFSPELFGFADAGGMATMLPRVLGVVMAATALMTRYELGVMKVLPMSTHLMLDLMAGVLLAVSPWLFGFADLSRATTAFVVLGLLEAGTSLMTRRTPAVRSIQATR